MEKAETIICSTVFKLPNHFINYPGWKAAQKTPLLESHWSHIMLICFVGENKDMSYTSPVSVCHPAF